jgi:hypothetical protein
MKLEHFVATEEWCRKVYSCVKSINHLGIDSLDQHLGSIYALNEKTQLMATKSCWYVFLRYYGSMSF